MKKTPVLVAAVAGSVGLVAALATFKVLQIQAFAQMGALMAPPPPTVATAPAGESDWTTSLTAVGSLTAVRGVDIASEVTGRIVEIPFESGAAVAAGDVLVRLDDATERAQLLAAEATRDLAAIQARRTRELREGDTVAQSELDAAEARLREAEAQVAVASDALGRRVIRAPFAGSLGIRRVDLGQILQPGTPIVTLQDTSLLFADFTLPQKDLATVAVGQPVSVVVDGYAAPFRGEITAVNPLVDPATRNVAIRSGVPNPDGALRPGMFVRVAVELPGSERFVTLPATSIISAPYGSTVYVVEELVNPETQERFTGARQQPVTVVRARGDQVAIAGGVKPGETVVVSGGSKLRPNSPVRVDNSVLPPSEAAPRPPNT